MIWKLEYDVTIPLFNSSVVVHGTTYQNDNSKNIYSKTSF